MSEAVRARNKQLAEQQIPMDGMGEGLVKRRQSSVAEVGFLVQLSRRLKASAAGRGLIVVHPMLYGLLQWCSVMKGSLSLKHYLCRTTRILPFCSCCTHFKEFPWASQQQCH